MDIEVKLFGKLRDLAGVYEETVSTVKAVDISRLVKMLQDMHGADFAKEVTAIRGLRILVNGREYQLLAGMETLLKDKDSVVLLPPIEGG
jgi:MoaD family protein